MFLSREWDHRVVDGFFTFLSSSFQRQGNNLLINFQNSQINNQQWTAIAWGDDMSIVYKYPQDSENLEVVVFCVMNGQATMASGYTNTDGPPVLDQSLVVQGGNVAYNGGLRVSWKFSREHPDGVVCSAY